MGTYISHLRTAEIFLADLDYLEENAFVIGSLAPDSGIPNQDWSQYDPPRTVTHYLVAGKGRIQIEDMEFYRRYLKGRNKDKDVSQYSYLLGYFIHLICDNLWTLWIEEATIQYNRNMIEEMGKEAWSLIRQDWHDLDRIYYRDHSGQKLWQMMKSLNNYASPLEYLPPGAMSQQMDYIGNVYLQPTESRELDRRYPYLNEATMDRFVEESTKVTIEILNQEDKLLKSNTQTALSLLGPGQLVSYEYPIGDI